MTIQLIDVKTMAGMLACSQRSVWRMADAGRMPRPMKIGGMARWNRVDIETWIAQRCPDCRAAKAVRHA